MIGDRASVFAVNLTVKREDFQADYIADPEDARARYECKPMEAEDGFFTDTEAVDAAHVEREPIVRVSRQIVKRVTQRRDGTMVERSYVALRLDEDSWQPVEDAVHYLHGDPGKSGDAFALSLMHVERDRVRFRGVDSDPKDQYRGEVAVFRPGTTMYAGGARVVYWRPHTDNLVIQSGRCPASRALPAA